jgi:undecaprenyl-diphosphatase
MNAALRERAICIAANRWAARSGIRRFFGAVSRLGDGPAWYALAATLAVFGGEAGIETAKQLVVTAAATLPLYGALKRGARRPRPCAASADIRAWVAPLDEFSFPSGHTLHAVAFSMVATAMFPLLGWLLWPFTVAVALSRVILGLHYPSDVLVAAALGVAIANGVLLVT